MMDRLERCSASVAERVIRLACRHLPEGERELRVAEWAAELPAVLSDPDRSCRLHRLLRAVSYTVDLFRGVRRIAPRGGVRRWVSEQWELSEKGMVPRSMARASVPVLAWCAVVIAVVADS